MKKRIKREQSIKTKLLVITVTGLLVPVLVVITSMLISLNRVSAQSKNVAANQLYNNIKTNVQYETQIMVTSAESMYNSYTGKLSDQDKINLVLNTVRNTKYG